MSDYAARGNFTISQATLPVLAPLDSSIDQENLGIHLTPINGAAEAASVTPAPPPALLPPKKFDVGLAGLRVSHRAEATCFPDLDSFALELFSCPG